MEGDAGASRLTPIDTDDASPTPAAEVDDIDESAHEATDSDTEADAQAAATDTDELADFLQARPSAPGESRLGRRWLIGIAATLTVLAGGAGAGGFLLLRAHQDSEATARGDAAAVEQAKDCVAATQAPDIAAMATSAQKIIECGAGAFRSQAILYSGLLVEAYQAANAHVQVVELRAAQERNNADGSVEILVPLRVTVSNADTQNQEAGYRLRVTMVREEGKYRIAKLDQVAR